MSHSVIYLVPILEKIADLQTPNITLNGDCGHSMDATAVSVAASIMREPCRHQQLSAHDMINNALLSSLETSAAFRSLAKSCLKAEPWPDGVSASAASDFDLNPAGFETGQRPKSRAAAVLVPVLAHAKPTMLFTQRTDELPSHAGQISFPGGKIEPGETALAAALREAHEETGLAATFVEVLGFLPPYETATGYLITPVVGLVDPAAAFTIAPREVADIFDAPLSYVLDADQMAIESREWRGMSRRFYALRYGDRYIWGATAGIITSLRRALNQELTITGCVT